MLTLEREERAITEGLDRSMLVQLAGVIEQAAAALEDYEQPARSI